LPAFVDALLGGAATDPLRTLRLPHTLAQMIGWLRDKLRNWNNSPLAKWSVLFDGDYIATSDGTDTTHRLPIGELQKVIVQTDDSGPWGADVLYFLFTEASEPAGVFPIEAQGCQEFVNWLSTMPGYRESELARAMASTDVARFVVYEAGS
jgi:hypothetical protein